MGPLVFAFCGVTQELCSSITPLLTLNTRWVGRLQGLPRMTRSLGTADGIVPRSDSARGLAGLFLYFLLVQDH